MINAITPKTKIIFIANPNNPTGTYLNESEILELLEAAPKTTLVVLDEAYAEYVTASDYPNSLALIKNTPILWSLVPFQKFMALPIYV